MANFAVASKKQTDMKFPTILFSIIASLISFAAYPSAVQPNPKREFRGAWLHVIGQSQWQNKSTSQAKQYIIDQFDKLVDAGCNAVIFQVRPTADALYESDLGRLGSQAKEERLLLRCGIRWLLQSKRHTSAGWSSMLG